MKALRRCLALTVFLLCALSANGQEKHSSEVTRREVRFASGRVSLAGVVWLPAGARDVPGVVVIHGSGSSDRNQPWASAVARGLAERGIAVLLPDKRGSGESGGDWRTVGFEALADDAIAGAKYLQAQAGVAPGRVGLLGLSQGGHIAPLAAARSSDIAFVISLSASTVPIISQAVDEVEKKAERAGLSPEQIEEVNALHRLAIQYGLTGGGWEVYEKSLQEARQGSWAGLGIAEGFPDTPGHWVWAWARTVGEYDPLPYWRQLRVPAVLAYGMLDTQIRVAKSIRRMEEMIAERGGGDYTILVFGESGHGLRDPRTDGVRADLLDFLGRWIQQRTDARA